MKRIPLHAKDGSVRAFALVDDADFDRLSEHRWGMLNDGYACRWERRGGRAATLRAVLMHRVVAGAPEGMTVDHLNRDRLDNRRANLRAVSQADNNRNRGATKRSRTGHPGVFVRGEKFRVVFKHHGVRYAAGSFSDLEVAVTASMDLRREVLRSCKVPSCKVLHEVNIHGERVQS